MAVLICIPKQCKRVPFFHPLSSIVCRLSDDGHPDWCEVIPHCSFDLHFCNNEQRWASFRVFSSHLYVFSECLFRSSDHFLIELFVFLVFCWMSCLYILEINPLSVVWFAIIFSHSEGCLFTLFIVYFAVQNLVTMSHLFIFVFIFITLGGGS